MYPARVFIWLLVDSLQVIFMPFLWLTIYAEREVIEGFSRADIVTYYVLVLVVSLLARSHVRRIVQQDIIKGDLNAVLLKPIRYLLLRPMRELSYKVLLLCGTIPIIILVLTQVPQYVVLPDSLATWGFFGIACLLGYFISISMELSIGLLAVWTGDTKSIDALKNIAQYVLSGELAPLLFLPVFLQAIAVYTPFRYIISTPVEIFLGRIEFAEMMQHFLAAGAWILGLWLLLIFIWRKAVASYEGVGI